MKKFKALFLMLLLTAMPCSMLAQQKFVSSVAEPGSTYLTMAANDSCQIFEANETTERVIPVTTNLEIMASVSEKWCKVTPGKESVTLQLSENKGKDAREAVVTLYSRDNQRQTVLVQQAGTGAYIISKTPKVFIINKDLEFGIEIHANVDFDLTTPEWVKVVDGAFQSGVKTYKFKADEMSQKGSRTGEIVATSKDKKQQLTVAVEQSFEGYPRFAVVSDIHFGRGDALQKVPHSMKNLLAKNIDCMFIVGDLTDWGTYAQYSDLISVFSNPDVIPSDFPVYFMMGNHDHYGSGQDVYANYFRLNQPLHRYFDMKGYPCIIVSMSGVANDSYNDDCVKYMADHLALAAKEYPGKPIFVFTHVPPHNTVYGSKSWGTTRFDKILKNYPQVVLFAGHSHFPLGDPRSIHQKYYTTINDGTGTYSEVYSSDTDEGIHPAGFLKVTEGCIVNIDKDMNIEVERWDTFNDEEITPRWYINAPHDGSKFQYANRTGGESPKFKTGAKIEITDVEKENCKVVFPQAVDDEVVHHYRVEILNGETVVAQYRIFSGFYLNSRMQDPLEVFFTGLPDGSTLRARIFAIDSYNNESEPLYSDTFETEAYKPSPSVTAPVADLFDLEFTQDNKVVDRSAHKAKVEIARTAPKNYLDATYNCWGVKCTGSVSEIYKVMYEDDATIRDAFANGYTWELFFQPASVGSSCPMSSQESGGTGFEINSKGALMFYSNIKGYKSVIAPTPLKVNEYYHVVATYDPSMNELKMYMNGRPAGTTRVSGSFKLPVEGARWIGIGADAHKSVSGQFGFKGNILKAKMYSKAVSRDEAFRLYEEIEKMKK